MLVYIPRSIVGDIPGNELYFIDETCVGADHNSTHLRIMTALGQCGTVMEVNQSGFQYNSVGSLSQTE